MVDKKDINVKLGSDMEVMWTSVLENTKKQLLQAKIDQEIYEELLKLADKRLIEEQENSN